MTIKKGTLDNADDSSPAISRSIAHGTAESVAPMNCIFFINFES